jgi:dipeptidyl aminopeptidase/acylaminoacyl peptidase
VERTADAYNVEAHIFDDMTHDIPRDAGWQQVAGLVLNWIQKKDRLQ